MIKFEINSQNLKLVEKPSRDLIENQLNFIEINFKFSEEWEGVKKIVQFLQNRKNEEDYVRNISLGEENDVTIYLPFGIKEGTLKVSVFGEISSKDENNGETFTKFVQTSAYYLNVVKSGVYSDDLEIYEVPDKFYLYKQLEASDKWVINHNLNKYPSVTVVDSANTVVIADVNYIDMNKLEINFKTIMSGKAYLN